MTNIYDIARKARVSIATVSNVVNNKNKEVGEKTRKKVLKVMDEHKYIPNQVAANLVKGKTAVVGVVVSDINNPFFSELIQETEDILFGLKLSLFIADTRYSVKKSLGHVERLISMRLDGVLMLNNEIDDKVVKILSRNRIPTVLYNWDIVNDYICNLKIDFLKGMESALKTLYDLNHREIIFTNSDKPLKAFYDREEAFLKSISKLKLKDLKYKIYRGDSTISGGQDIIKKIMSDKDFKPTAIISVNDIQSIGILFSLINYKINVPKDMSLIGLDNIYLSSVVIPKLTTIDLSAKRVASIVIKMLLDLTESKDKKGFERTIKTNLLMRDSVSKIY